MKTILSIAGSDSSGGAGIQADMRTFTELFVDAASSITAITSQSQSSISDIHYMPSAIVKNQIDMAAKDTGFTVVKTGMLGTAEIVKVVTLKMTEYNIEHLIVDPVIRSSTDVPLLSRGGIEALKQMLFPVSFLITPNLYEAGLLSGISINNVQHMEDAAVVLHKLGTKNVLIKGGHLQGKPIDVLYDGNTFHQFKSYRIKNDMHGSGCVLSAAIAAELAKGADLIPAIQTAKDFVGNKILQNSSCGNNTDVLKNISAAIKILSTLKAGSLMPEVQANMAYALPDAERQTDVAAIPGRIVKVLNDIYTIKPPAFGCSQHVAAIVLTAMKYDKNKRAAMNIAYNEDIIEKCRKIGLNVAWFDRAKEPEAVKEREGSTLEWGTDSVIKKLNGVVPDIVYDKGDVGKEPMVRIIAEAPLKIVEIIKKILDKGE